MKEQLETIVVENDSQGICWITLNRPHKYNAWNFQMYVDIMSVLRTADADTSCKLIVLTGSGKYFSSGNDQSNFMDPDAAQPPKKQIFGALIDLLIDMETPMVALVNGPAVGMGVTMLSHFDLVIASDQATFLTPFTKLGLCAEGCSSYLFPQIMGYSNASQMLLFNKKASAEEMFAWGLVSTVIPNAVFAERTQAIIREIAQLPAKALRTGRSLLRSKGVKDKLHEVNQLEMNTLSELLASPEAWEAVLRFQSRKAKL